MRKTYYIRKEGGGGEPDARNRKDRPPVLNFDSATPLDAWEKMRIEIDKHFLKIITERQARIHETLMKESGALQPTVREAVIDEILKAFPLASTVHLCLLFSVLTFSVISISFRILRRDRFSPEPTSGEPVNSTRVDSGELTGKPENLTSSTILTQSAGTLDDVFSNYPQAEQPFLDAISDANFDNGVKGPDYHFRKERLLILLHLLKNYPELTASQISSLRDAVLNNKDNQKALKLLRNFALLRSSELTSVELAIKL